MIIGKRLDEESRKVLFQFLCNIIHKINQDAGLVLPFREFAAFRAFARVSHHVILADRQDLAPWMFAQPLSGIGYQFLPHLQIRQAQLPLARSSWNTFAIHQAKPLWMRIEVFVAGEQPPESMAPAENWDMPSKLLGQFLKLTIVLHSRREDGMARNIPIVCLAAEKRWRISTRKRRHAEFPDRRNKFRLRSPPPHPNIVLQEGIDGI